MNILHSLISVSRSKSKTHHLVCPVDGGDCSYGLGRNCDSIFTSQNCMREFTLRDLAVGQEARWDHKRGALV